MDLEEPLKLWAHKVCHLAWCHEHDSGIQKFLRGHSGLRLLTQTQWSLSAMYRVLLHQALETVRPQNDVFLVNECVSHT